ncbi:MULTISPECIES: GlsB/YeaQ/YmgE family stress response membrane protein [Qipengyuania]|uniref:GlsB/YeaQ/YmgE family stress response membrane protein n=1 Tax=Qipengyuania soli TaxID=2782568 RepID=A0A7S8F481_9SPHN|nr:GlsB/YeaQ/YmgE family stress response membrane protein [Qipengyuania soli]QPC98859.1 GlsB/YeaQ/YmgE family stress response membrane protein [Qipengyuania soli]
MGLLILVVVGAILGWLATIVLRIEDGRGILTNALVGIFGALVAGFVAGNGLFLGALTGSALMWSVLGAILALAAFNVAKQRAFR